MGKRVLELLSVEVFTCLAEEKVMVEDYRRDYNRRRPHRAHGMMTPEAFATAWKTAHEAALAGSELRSPFGIELRSPFGIELRSPSGLAALDAGESPNVAAPTNHQLSQQVDR